MLRNARKKWPCLILLAYLTLAVTGSFAFSTGEAVGYAGLSTAGGVHAGFIFPAVYAVDWLAENEATIGKANAVPVSSLRYGLLRFFAFTGIYFAIMCYARSYFLEMKNVNSGIYKNNILLKLRN